MIKQGRADRLKAAGVDTVEKLWKCDIADVARHPAFATDDGLLGQLPLLQGYAKAHATGQDRMGPRFAIAASIPNAPEAALNQRNTVFMKSAVNRSQPNFNLGRLG